MVPAERLSSLRKISSSALTSKLSGKSESWWTGDVRKADKVSGLTPPRMNSN